MVITWLLNHDPAVRPTAVELLKSEHLPPPQMEESELHEVLHHTLANVDGKAYRTMMSQIFAQRISPAIDYTYDSDMLKVCRCSRDVWVWLFSVLSFLKICLYGWTCSISKRIALSQDSPSHWFPFKTTVSAVWVWIAASHLSLTLILQWRNHQCLIVEAKALRLWPDDDFLHSEFLSN